MAWLINMITFDRVETKGIKETHFKMSAVNISLTFTVQSRSNVPERNGKSNEGNSKEQQRKMTLRLLRAG